MSTAGAVAATAASRPYPPNVLVLNSDHRLHGTIREALEKTPSEITFADPLQESTRILEHTQAFSVVVIDATDPEMAFSLLEKIKNIWPEARIVFLSNDMEFWMESIQRGAYDMLPIPLHGPDLAWIVNGAISRLGAA